MTMQVSQRAAYYMWWLWWSEQSKVPHGLTMSAVCSKGSCPWLWDVLDRSITFLFKQQKINSPQKWQQVVSCLGLEQPTEFRSEGYLIALFDRNAPFPKIYMGGNRAGSGGVGAPPRRVPSQVRRVCDGMYAQGQLTPIFTAS